jgi:hypothetical protein
MFRQGKLHSLQTVYLRIYKSLDSFLHIHLFFWRSIMKFAAKVAVIAAVSAATVNIAHSPAYALSVTQNNNGFDLLNALLGNTNGLSNFTVSTTGASEAFGLFSNDTVFGLGSGVVLGTGNVVDVEGPNNSTEQTTIFGTPGDPSIPDSFDLAELEISFDADDTVDKIFFEYVFGSEEFLEFAGSAFNDSFQLLLNGVNFALLGNGLPVTINNLATSPAGPFDPAFVENTGDETQLDAYTKVLLFEGLLTKNAKNTLTIKIADVGDSALDSAVFIKGSSIGVVPPTDIPTPALLPGLLGMGVAALRKRKQEGSESEA